MMGFGVSRMAAGVVVVVVMMMIVAPFFGQLAGVSSEPFRLGRRLMQTGNGTQPARQSDDTVRVDPLNHLKKYRGGYDVTNKHYWSSTAFTGIHGYAIAVLWILCGLSYGVYLLVTSFCYKNKGEKLRRKPSACRKLCNLWPVLVAVLFTILVIIGCGLVLGGNAKFHSRAKTVVGILIDTADDASETIYNTTTAMKDMTTSLASVNATGDVTDFLNSTSQNLDSQAAEIHRQARKNRRAIYNALKIVSVVTTVVISLSLLAAIATSASGILRLRRTQQLFIGICWILTFFCWIFFGTYYFIDNFADDTCTALEGFQENPYHNSLSSILPCDELESAKSVLLNVREEVYSMVNEVNENISTSYGNIAQICNPFSGPPSYQYQPQECPANSFQIGQIPQLLNLLTCPDTEGSTCIGGIVFPTNYYNMVEGYTTSIQRLLDQYPDMENLVECQTVTIAFAEILNKHCKPLKRYTRMVWAAMAFLSAVMVALLLIWTNEIHYQQYQHHSSDSSVMKPDSTALDTLESGIPKTHNDDDSRTN